MNTNQPEEFSESGDPVYKYQPLDTPIEPVSGDAAVVHYIDAHLKQFFDDEDILVLHEIISDKVHIDSYIVKADESRDFNIVMTGGMSSLPMSVPEGMEPLAYTELVMLLPKDWPLSPEAFENEDNYWPVRQLKQVARFPHLYGTWVGQGHTITNGNPAEPMSPNCAFEGVILLPGFTLPEGFTTIEAEDRVVSILSLIPLYGEEMEYKLKKGTDALLEKFDRYQISEVIDVNRKNTCKKKFGIF